MAEVIPFPLYPIRDGEEQHVRRILSAMGQMPFGGSYEPLRRPQRQFAERVNDRLGGKLDLDALASYLEALRAILVDHAAMEHERAKELDRLRFDIAAVRRLFGLGEK